MRLIRALVRLFHRPRVQYTDELDAPGMLDIRLTPERQEGLRREFTKLDRALRHPGMIRERLRAQQVARRDRLDDISDDEHAAWTALAAQLDTTTRTGSDQ
jgi:hypothetical protein